MSDRGLHSLLIFSANDGGLDMLESHLGGGAKKMKTRSNFHMEIVDGADHTFTPVWSQQWLYETIAGHVADRFA